MLTDDQINTLAGDEERSALDYQSEINKDRETLQKFYSLQPFGDEREGQSKVITSDVADTVEWMVPSLLRMFTQGRYIAEFDYDTEEAEQEALEKKLYANHVFTRQNDGVLILHNMIKDALLQYTGIVKITQDVKKKAVVDRYESLTDIEVKKLKSDKELMVETEKTDDGYYDVKTKWIEELDYQCIENIPPEEFCINKDARSFKDARFIGHRSPKTRSDLIAMGFDRKVVESLAADEHEDEQGIKNARNHDLNSTIGINPTHHKPNDIIWLGEYYYDLDVDGDGITETWQIFRAGNTLLKKEQVDDHPFCVIVPVPLPHRAIGDCPAAQVADLQQINSVLNRQLLNNIYATNFQRPIVNENVNMDDLLTPRAGGPIRVDGKGPVSGNIESFRVDPIAPQILQAIEHVQGMKELRTGITRYSQGLDAESLNKTATGFKGIMQAGEQRLELIARIFANTGIKDLFTKIIDNAKNYQKTNLKISLNGQVVEIDPAKWNYGGDCTINVGVSGSERQEKIANLGYMLSKQLELIQSGSVVTDEAKMFNTLDKLVVEMGLKDSSVYFNDPEQPNETLQAMNSQLTQQLQQLQSQLQNPLAEAETIKANARLQEIEFKENLLTQRELLKLQNDNEKFREEMIAKLTELELKYGENVPGSAV